MPSLDGVDATCLLLIGDRVVLRANGPPEAEYAMFEIGEIELRATAPGRVREFGYQTTVEQARQRLANAGMTAPLAREIATAMQPVLAQAYARGPSARRVAAHLSPSELFQADSYDSPSKLYRGVFLDLAILANDAQLPSTSATLQALSLATMLETEDPETVVLLSTDACTRDAKPGSRTYKRPSFTDAQRLVNALGGLAHRAPRPEIHDALPRADVIAFLRARADASPEDARALYKQLENAVSERDMPERGPLASPDLWAIETRIESGTYDGVLDAIDQAERHYGRTPGTTYLRARASLTMQLEPAKLIAERVSALALSMTSFRELNLLAAEAWLESGDPRRAMPYARDLVDSPGVDEGLLLRAQRLLARAVGAAPPPPASNPRPMVSAAPPPSARPAEMSALELAQMAASEMAAALANIGPAPLDLESLEPIDIVPSLPTPPPPPAASKRPPPPPLPSSRRMQAAAPAPVAPPAMREPSSMMMVGRDPFLEPPPAREPTPPPTKPKPLPVTESSLPPAREPSGHPEAIPVAKPSFPPLYAKPAIAEIADHTPPPPLEIELTPVDPAASFTLDLPGPEALPPPPASAPPAPSRPPSMPRPRLSGVFMETRPSSSYDPRAEPDSPIVPRSASSEPRRSVPEPLFPSAAPARRASDPSVTRAPPSSEVSAHDRPTPMRPPVTEAVGEANLDIASTRPPPVMPLPDPESFQPAGPARSFMHGASLPPYRHEEPAPLLPKAPLLPRLAGDDLAEHLPLPPGLGGDQKVNDALPTSVLEARIQFTLLSRELGLDYRLKRGLDLKTDVSGIEAMQSVLLESFPDRVVRTGDEAWELRKHGAFLSEILARRLDAEWLDISPNELGYWVMIVPPDTRVWPFGRVARLIAMGHKERDLVSYFFELQSRARGR